MRGGIEEKKSKDGKSLMGSISTIEWQVQKIRKEV